MLLRELMSSLEKSSNNLNNNSLFVIIFGMIHYISELNEMSDNK